jgi:hypothetical protein
MEEQPTPARRPNKPEIIVKASTPDACVDCFRRQLEAQPDAEPSCILQDKMGAINPNTDRAKLEFGRTIGWAEGNNCPDERIESLGQAIFGALHNGQRFIHRGTIPSEPIRGYVSEINTERWEYYRKRRNSGHR